MPDGIDFARHGACALIALWRIEHDAGRGNGTYSRRRCNRRTADFLVVVKNLQDQARTLAADEEVLRATSHHVLPEQHAEGALEGNAVSCRVDHNGDGSAGSRGSAHVSQPLPCTVVATGQKTEQPARGGST